MLFLGELGLSLWRKPKTSRVGQLPTQSPHCSLVSDPGMGGCGAAGQLSLLPSAMVHPIMDSMGEEGWLILVSGYAADAEGFQSLGKDHHFQQWMEIRE